MSAKILLGKNGIGETLLERENVPEENVTIHS